MSVEEGWIDYNGHMNVAYYVLLFDRVVDQAFATIGLGPEYVRARALSYFTVELHVCYLRELTAHAPVIGTAQLLGHDDKRMRLYLELTHAEEGWVAASAEELFLHVDLTSRRAAPFPADIRARLTAMQAAHAALHWPERAGRPIRLEP
ncbi:thioesterase family protein [Faunimonas sp. B44]|uniref:thioesterase family protein n=1 Tax=Faunimonas sp. B44 TaxID=3461493 RepID=UPI0040443BBD